VTASKPRALRAGMKKVWPKRRPPIARLRREGQAVPPLTRTGRKAAQCE